MKNRTRLQMPHPLRAADGSTLAYTESGRGETLLLVHGSLADFRMWGAMMDKLEKKYRVVAYSRRCHWPNACARAASYTTEAHVADLAGIIRGFGVGPVHLAGHSSGGAIVAQLALQHPQLVRRVILIEPGIYSLLPEDDRGRLLRAEIGEAGARARQALMHEQDEEAIRQLMDFVFRPRSYADLSEPLRKSMLENAASLRAAVVSGVPAPEFTCAEAKKLAMPVLLLEGKSTAPEFRMMNDALARCLPNFQRAVISGADHGLIFGAPEPTAAALDRFLARGKPR